MLFRLLCFGASLAVGAAVYPRKLPYRGYLFMLGCAVAIATSVMTARTTVVFLHGTGGNWSLGCWLVASAAAEAYFRTVCPSAGPLGLWGVDAHGLVRQTTVQFKASEHEPVVLVGLSAGAVGEIAPLLSEEIAGAAMLFGGHLAARGFSKSLLLLYGEEDERFPVHIMRFVRDALSGPEQRLTVA